MLKSLTLIMVFCGSFAGQQRIPGRTGGSVNNPSLRPPVSPRSATLSPAAQAAEQQDFLACGKAIPGLPKGDFYRLQSISKALTDQKHVVSTPQLAEAIGPSGNVTDVIVKQLGSSVTNSKALSLAHKLEKEADKYADDRCKNDSSCN
jgi:hypothetical protein